MNNDTAFNDLNAIVQAHGLKTTAFKRLTIVISGIFLSLFLFNHMFSKWMIVFFFVCRQGSGRAGKSGVANSMQDVPFIDTDSTVAAKKYVVNVSTATLDGNKWGTYSKPEREYLAAIAMRAHNTGDEGNDQEVSFDPVNVSSFFPHLYLWQR